MLLPSPGPHALLLVCSLTAPVVRRHARQQSHRFHSLWIHHVGVLSDCCSADRTGSANGSSRWAPPADTRRTVSVQIAQALLCGHASPR